MLVPLSLTFSHIASYGFASHHLGRHTDVYCRLRNLLTNRLILTIRNLSPESVRQGVMSIPIKPSFGRTRIVDSVIEPQNTSYWEYDTSHDILADEFLQSGTSSAISTELNRGITCVAVVSHAYSSMRICFYIGLHA